MAIEQELVRELLSGIVKTKPDIRANDHKWLIAMLKDLYNPQRQINHADCFKEINGLANCLAWGIVDDIRKCYGKTLELHEAKTLLNQLVKDYGQQEDLSRWCILSWCIALDKRIDFSSISRTSAGSIPITDQSSDVAANNYSEQLFINYASEQLKSNNLDTKIEFDLFAKGKQINLTDRRIKSIIESIQNKMFEEKRLAIYKREQELKIKEEAKKKELEKINEQLRIEAEERKKEEAERIRARLKWIAAGGWTMYGHDVQHTRRSPFIGPQTNNLKWAFPTFNAIVSSPAIDFDGTVYIGSKDNKFYSINPDGKLKAMFNIGVRIESSPAIGVDGTIYIGDCSDDDDFVLINDGHRLFAINPNGTRKWSFKADGVLFSSPVIGPNGNIYIGGGDSNLYAIDITGNLIWTLQIKGAVFSSPAIGYNGIIYFGCQDQKLYAVSQAGIKLWTFKTGGLIDSSPAIGSDGTIYIGSKDGTLYAVHPDGELKWSFKTGRWLSFSQIISSPAIGIDEQIYITNTTGKLFAINSDGTLNWSVDIGSRYTFRPVLSSPAIDGAGTIYVGSEDYNLYALDSNGLLKWKFRTSSIISSSPAIGADGTIYFGCNDGYLYAIGPGEGE